MRAARAIGALLDMTAWRLLALILALSGCSAEPGILVDIGVWPRDAEVLRVRSRLNGQPGTEQILQREQTRFVVYAPPGSQGTLALDLSGFDASGCKVASGRIEREIGDVLPPVHEVQVPLTQLAPATCTLTLNTPDGVITGGRPDVVCEASASPCEIELPRGTRLSLTATGRTKEQIQLWNQGCTGYGRSCDITLTENRAVSLQWEPQLCSADGWCWVNPVQSFVPAEILLGRSGEAWLAGTGSFVLRCSDGACAAIPAGSTVGTLSSLTLSAGKLWGLRSGLLIACSSESCVEVPTGQSAPLESVSMNEHGEGYAVGQLGSMVRCVGETCSAMPRMGSVQFRKVSINSRGEAWAIGNKGSTVHCSSGGSCSSVTLPIAPAEYYDVHVTEDGTAWLLGWPNALRCSGESCTPVATIQQFGSGWLLGGRSGAVWLPQGAGPVHRCTQEGCIPIETVEISSSAGVPAVADIDAVMQLLNGTVARCTASRCYASSLSFPNSRSVKMSPSGELWILSEGGGISRCRGEGCASTASTSILRTLTAVSTSGHEAWAIGPEATLLRCKEDGCDRDPSGLAFGPDYHPNTLASGGWVWVSGTTDVWNEGSMLRCAKDGTCVSVPIDSEAIVSGLGAGSSEAWAISLEGQVFRCTEVGCSSLYSGPPIIPMAVSVDGNETAWIAGRAGAFLRCSGASCSTVPGIPDWSLVTISSSSSLTLAGGSQGAVVACDGKSCSGVPSGTTENLLGASVNGAGEGWLVGSLGAMVRCRGATCSTVPSQTTELLVSVVTPQSGVAWAVGWKGTIVSCKGGSCSTVESGTRNDLRGVAASDSSGVWAVGLDGTVLHHAP